MLGMQGKWKVVHKGSDSDLGKYDGSVRSSQGAKVEGGAEFPVLVNLGHEY